MKSFVSCLMFMFVINLFATAITVSEDEINNLEIIDSSIDQTSILFTLSEIEKKDVSIDEVEYSNLFLKHGGQIMQASAPQLPFRVISIIIPGNSSMSVNITNAEYKDFEMKIAPSKGLIKFGEDYDKIPYEFGERYLQDEFYPRDIVTIGEPYLIRKLRGLDCKVNPVQYNPVKNIVRIYSRIEFEIIENGTGRINTVNNENISIKRTFDEIYESHFDNYEQFLTNNRYDEISDTPGKLLVVCHDDFEDAMQPYLNWKRQKGIESELVLISEAASSGNELLEYLQDYYENDDELVWVLLVGDYPLIPVIYSFDTYAGDGFFARVAGTDPYADIIVGRFSAETESEVATQVERTIYHERDITGGDWLNKAAGCAYDGMGSGMHNEGGHEHMNYIRDDLLDYGYDVVDQIYESAGGSTAMLADALNEGRGIVNYIGHGDITFYYSIPFDISDVNALENNHMLPVIHNCACLVGHFAGNDCFAEAWLKAENDEGPIGAVAFLGSAESQWIGVPEYGQDEYVDLLCDEACGTIGGLWFNSIIYAMEITSEFNQLATWNLFGDPSLSMLSKEPDYMTVEHLPQMLIGMGEFQVETGIPDVLVCLSRDDEIQAHGITNESGEIFLDTSELEPVPGFLTLTATALNKVTYVTEIQLIPAEGPFLYIDEYSILSGDDELLEAGETAYFDMQICNYGSEDATEINLTMNVEHELVHIIDSEEYIASIASNESVSLEDIFCFELDQLIGAGCPIQVNIEMQSLEDSWERTFWLCTDAPQGLWINPGEFTFEMIGEDTLLAGISVLNNQEDSEEFGVRLVNVSQRNIEGSFIECDTDNFLPGQPQRWDFTVYNYSQDSEWISGITMIFPEEVMVTDIEPFVGAGGGDMETDALPGEGITIDWTGVSPNGWGYLHDGESATTTIEFIVNDLSVDSLYVDWVLTGDGYGSEPHNESGRLNFINPLSWIELQEISRNIPAGTFHVFEFMIDSSNLADGDYLCEIVLSNGEEEFTVPVALNLSSTNEEDKTIPEISAFELDAYPNPFNPLININFEIKEAGFFSVNVYNIKGQCVHSIINEKMSKGNYHISWDAARYSSGIYFIAAEKDNNREVEKVLLLK